MTKKFSILKMTQGEESKIIHETHSHYEAKNQLRTVRLDIGEQAVLRTHLNGETKVLNVRDNGYCA